jgi:hypothetical protein
LASFDGHDVQWAPQLAIKWDEQSRGHWSRGLAGMAIGPLK